MTYVDGLSCISEALGDESQQDTFKNSQSSTLGNENSDRSNPFINVRAPTFTLQPLYNRIKSSLGDETKPCLLVIDDLTALLSIGVHLQQITNFIHYCAFLMCHSPTVSDGCLVTLVHSDNDADDEESQLLWKQLWYLANMEFQVKGLTSGYCKDVHGQLTITRRDQRNTKHSSKIAQYKIHDKNVTCFTPGMSKAVL